ncbi:protein PIN-LIKES 6-like [Hibiscus syriacus]|uniref:protein PIN-LIKES 6-like n=1 Tax=Hibiscus syriacus TaxID=106335 RepID=UPI0019248E09|nr:protein PIN-LIKES 6-like [Hibiscus syriacus]
MVFEVAVVFHIHFGEPSNVFLSCFFLAIIYMLQILAMIIGTVLVLKKLIFTSCAPLYFFTDSCIILDKALIPCILLALGGNLVDGPGPGSARIGVRTLVAIIIGRLILVPPAGLAIAFTLAGWIILYLKILF